MKNWGNYQPNGKVRKHSITGIAVTLDVKDAPEGYTAVDADCVVVENVNMCKSCDWKKDCNAKICSCMRYNRKDDCNVIFKKVS